MVVTNSRVGNLGGNISILCSIINYESKDINIEIVGKTYSR